MRRDHADETAARVARLRVPLSRIELAASQLMRVATTPGARALADGISEAVGELDDQIAAALCDIVGTPPTADPIEDCRPVLDALHRRLAPALRAQAIDWTHPLGSTPTDPVGGSRRATRSAALALLEAGVALAGPHGRLSISLMPDPDARRYGVVLRVHPASSAQREVARPEDTPGPHEQSAFAAARGFARNTGRSLDVVDQPDGLGAVLWIAQESSPCVG